MIEFAITRAIGMGPLPDLLEERGGSRSVARVFGSAEVPLALIEERRHWMPLDLMARLFERGAWEIGDPLFGLSVGKTMQPGDYGLWLVHAMQAETLREGIERAGQFLPHHQKGGTLGFAPRGAGRVAFRYWNPKSCDPAYRQHSDHIVPTMIGFARSYLGQGWLPESVEVAYDAGDWEDPISAMNTREAAIGVPWRFGCGATAIVFQESDLDRSRPMPAALRGSVVTSAEVLAEDLAGRSILPTDRFGAMIAMRLLDGATDIEGAARALGLGVRTFQRRLAENGLSYASLLSRIRMTRAAALLLETDRPVGEIALDTGYGDPAHFTRAFKRHHGEAPSTFRTKPS